MHRSSTARVLVLAALLLVPEALRAGGGSERDRPADAPPRPAAAPVDIQAYWILEEGAANAEMLLERFYLPTSLSVLRWTRFEVTSGGVELAGAGGGYRVTRKQEILSEAWQGNLLRGYSLRIDFTGQAEEPSGSSRRLTVRFAYDTGRPDGGHPGAVIPQPLQQALLQGIKASGRNSGRARVLELRYEGRGRFEAEIEVQ